MLEADYILPIDMADSISCLKCSNQQQNLVVCGSWSGQVKCVGLALGEREDHSLQIPCHALSYNHTCPVLSVCIDQSRVLSSGCNNIVKCFDMQHGAESDIALNCIHEPIHHIESVHDDKFILTGSWDGSIRLFDSCSYKLISQIKIAPQYEATVLSCRFPILLVAHLTSIYQVDLRFSTVKVGSSYYEC